jgi:hypothetical protein
MGLVAAIGSEQSGWGGDNTERNRSEMGLVGDGRRFAITYSLYVLYTEEYEKDNRKRTKKSAINLKSCLPFNYS